MWEAEGVAETRWRVEQAPLLPLGPSPKYSVTVQQHWLPRPGEHLRLRPLLCNRCAKAKKNGPNERTDQSSRKNIDEEIAHLSDAQFKTRVIRKLTELVEFDHKLDEKMKAMLNEIKENVQGTSSDGKETGTHINGMDQKEERNIQPEKNEETRIQKYEESLRNLQDNFKYSNIRIIGVPEGEVEEQEMENLFE